MKNKHLYFILIAIASLFLLLCFSLFYFSQNDSKQFHAITDSLFREELKEDSLSLHYTLLDPAHYGLDNTPVSFPCFSEGDFADNFHSLNDYKTRLLKINSKHLTKEDVFYYQNLLAYIEMQLEGCQFEYYSEPLAPNSGIQSQLPILLAEFSFYSRENVETYLSLLKEVDTYFDSILLYEQKKADAGLFMSKESMEKVVLQCDTIITKDSLEDNSHFLVKTFEERIRQLTADNLITPLEETSYCKQNKEILLSQVYPAYVSLGDELFLMRKSGTNANGLYYLTRGKDYYTFLVKSVTGSEKSMDELKEMLVLKMQQTYDELSSVSNRISVQLPNADNNFSTLLPLKNADAMINNLRLQIQKDYPPFPVSEGKIACQIKKVDESLQNYVSPAFYLTPPVDYALHNVIYINEKEALESIDLYTTLAHEGYPGHLYQSVYYLLSQPPTDSLPLRNIMYYGGYTEGWAYYAENNSYEYACSLLSDSSKKALVSDYFELCRLNRNLQLCLFSLLDISIHYDGLTYEKTKLLLHDFGVKEEKITKDIYSYIVEEPANYLKYCVGYLEILECKEAAKKYWGSNYSDLNFHTFFLETGPTTFPLLKREIENSTYSQFVSAAKKH